MQRVPNRGPGCAQISYMETLRCEMVALSKVGTMYPVGALRKAMAIRSWGCANDSCFRKGRAAAEAHT